MVLEWEGSTKIRERLRDSNICLDFKEVKGRKLKIKSV